MYEPARARLRPRWRAALGAAALLIGVLPVCLPASTPAAPAAGAAYRLLDADSPYLHQHAGDAVQWYPWGEEAFARARAEDRPVFVSVGYSTCYWCHVAQRTLYADPAIAGLMNRWFINIKVDREQRPDVDQIFMRARHLLAGDRGWPNNLFLTPQGQPFFAGSYFAPRSDEHARPGFAELLRSIHQRWTARRGELLATARRVHAQMAGGDAGAGPPHVDRPAAVSSADAAAWRAAAVEALLARFEPLQGGFAEPGRAARFPRSPLLGFLLAEHRAAADADIAEALIVTLDAMALGGIHDHLGGGFHRYAIDPDWSIPHFEKMLYDNAQLLRVYAEAYAQFGSPLYRHTATQIAGYLGSRLRAPGGGFYTAEDAQVDGVEGASHVWTRPAITALLGAGAARRLLDVYALEALPAHAGGPTAAGGVLRLRAMPGGADALAGHAALAATLAALAPARHTLLAGRDRREPPLRDDKLGVDLNGLAIDALARAGRALGEPSMVDMARQAADHVLAVAGTGGDRPLAHQVLAGRASGAALLADHAHLARGLLALHAVTGELQWRTHARRLADDMLERHGRSGGRLALSPHAKALPLPLAEYGDRDMPSATSAAIEVLTVLGALPGGEHHARAASAALSWHAERIGRAPQDWPALLGVLASPAARVALVDAGRVAGPGQAAAALGSDHVVSALARVDRAASRIDIELRIADGYHVNANPASLDFLVPTGVSFGGAVPVRVDYPPARRLHLAFAGTELAVYDGSVTIRAQFEAPVDIDDDGGVLLTVQACDDSVCLLPARISVPLAP